MAATVHSCFCAWNIHSDNLIGWNVLVGGGLEPAVIVSDGDILKSSRSENDVWGFGCFFFFFFLALFGLLPGITKAMHYCWPVLLYLQLPEQNGQVYAGHHPQHPAQRRRQRRRRDAWSHCLQAGQWHAGQAAARLCALWGDGAPAEDGNPAAHEHLPAPGDWPHAEGHRACSCHLERPETGHRRHHHHEREPEGRAGLHVRRPCSQPVEKGQGRLCSLRLLLYLYARKGIWDRWMV